MTTRTRHSIRARCYDYSWPGAYFITICASEHKPVFGGITDGVVALSEIGRVVHEEWHETPRIRAFVELDEFVVMPNHFHAIVFFTEPVLVGAHCVRPDSMQRIPNGGGARSAPLRPSKSCVPVRAPKSLGSLIAGFKAAVSSRCKNMGLFPVWQRNYFEHIVRDERGLERIRDYIAANPSRWELDRENPQRRSVDEFDRWLEEMR